ncbi:MAG: hypothetical protein K0U37_04250 [Gammaproteobacteria bacterium]|nr:hypothetical protein [Gammaproteobacteria bacterium]
MPGHFYISLDGTDALLADKFKIEKLDGGLIQVNGVLVDTNQQLEMLTPTFFSATAADNPTIQKFKTFFDKKGPFALTSTPRIPLIRDIPLRSQTVNDPDGLQRAAFASFLEQEILVNQWTHLFADDYKAFKSEIMRCYQDSPAPLAEKTITHDDEGNVLASGGYQVAQHEIKGVKLWLRVPESNSETDISAALDRTLNDTDNTTVMVEHLKPKLNAYNRLAFNVRGVDKQCFSREDIQNTPLGGGHQFFLMLDRAQQTIYGINNTRGAGDVNFLFYKNQIEIFLKSMGDNTDYRFKLLEGKSRQPDDETYLEQVCGISQFFHYVALLSSADSNVNKLRDEVPARISTLMYLLQYAVINQNEELLQMLDKLADDLNKTIKNKYVVTGRSKVTGMLDAIYSTTWVNAAMKIREPEELNRSAADYHIKKKVQDDAFADKVSRDPDVYVARNLKQAFKTHLDAVARGTETLEAAQAACLAHVKNARATLESHHKLAYFFANLIAAVLSLGIVPVATRVCTGQWAFFRPANAWRLDTVEKDTKTLGLKAIPDEDVPDEGSDAKPQ